MTSTKLFEWLTLDVYTELTDATKPIGVVVNRFELYNEHVVGKNNFFIVDACRRVGQKPPADPMRAPDFAETFSVCRVH